MSDEPQAGIAACDLATEILIRRNQRTERDRRVTPQDHPRASAIGYCAREVYHQIVDWQLREAPDVPLLQRFRRGSEVESIVVRELLADGFDVHAQQVTFEVREHVPELGHDLIICRGHQDGRIAWQGDAPVFEVKSLNPNVWGQVESIGDFFRMGKFWVKYPRQMLLYLFNAAEPYGLFILDDCLGHWKILPMVLDDYLDECEDALQTARAAAIGAKTGEPPPYCSDPEVCLECWCRTAGVCSPPLDFTPEKFIELHADDTAYSLEIMEDTHREYKIYADIDKAIKERMKLYGPGRYVAGDWLITVKQQANGIRTTWQRLAAETNQPGAASGAEKAPASGGNDGAAAGLDGVWRE